MFVVCILIEWMDHVDFELRLLKVKSDQSDAKWTLFSTDNLNHYLVIDMD